jgi:hypothetical protein
MNKPIQDLSGLRFPNFTVSYAADNAPSGPDKVWIVICHACHGTVQLRQAKLNAGKGAGHRCPSHPLIRAANRRSGLS